MATKTTASPKTDMLKLNIKPPTVDERALTKQGEDLKEKIDSIVIKDQTTYTTASLELGNIVRYKDYLEGIFGPAKKSLNDAIKNIRDEEKRIIGPRLTFAQGLELSLRGKMSKYIVAEEDRKRKEAARIQAENDAKAEVERKKLLKQAEKAEEKGKDAKAEVLRNAAESIYSPPVETKPAVNFTGTGTTGRDDISIEIVDPRLFLKYLLDSGAPVIDMIEFKPAKIKAYVKNLPLLEGETVQKAPGIKVEKTKIINVYA
jgi:hypothetical protein